MLDKEIVAIKVNGDYACFTRPDLKVERMTYPCMTPSAARGILDSILWKPEFKWYVRRIKVLKPVKYASVRRNEINTKQSANPILIEERRAQRNSIVLKEVEYIIEASVYQDGKDEKNPPKKYVEMFNRRVRKGQCFRRPYLGTREFAAEFIELTGEEQPIEELIPIRSMLFDMFYDEQGIPKPIYFYDVKVENGILNCEVPENDMMMKSTHFQPAIGDDISKAIYNLSDGMEV